MVHPCHLSSKQLSDDVLAISLFIFWERKTHNPQGSSPLFWSFSSSPICFPWERRLQAPSSLLWPYSCSSLCFPSFLLERATRPTISFFFAFFVSLLFSFHECCQKSSPGGFPSKKWPRAIGASAGKSWRCCFVWSTPFWKFGSILLGTWLRFSLSWQIGIWYFK